jgi:hypothetical protein
MICPGDRTSTIFSTASKLLRNQMRATAFGLRKKNNYQCVALLSVFVVTEV